MTIVAMYPSAQKVNVVNDRSNVERRSEASETGCGAGSSRGALSEASATGPRSAAASGSATLHCEMLTPQALTLVDLNQQQVDAIVRSVPGGERNVQDIYPLLPLQEGMLFHRLLNDRGDAYVLSTLFELQCHALVGELTNAIQKVIDRHDALRSAVHWEMLPRPVQVVYRRAALSVQELVTERDRDPIEQLNEWMTPMRQKLDLKCAPLARLLVMEAPRGTKWYALLQVHHLVCDHQSLKTLVAEAIAYLGGCGQELRTPAAYRSFVAGALARTRLQEAEVFFRRRLSEIDEPTAPFALFDVHGDGTRIGEFCRTLDPVLQKRLRARAREMGVSAARLFHAAWALVVAHTSGRDDVVFGTVLRTDRYRAVQEQPMLGMFVNTLPLRLQLQGVTARELVEQTNRELSELLEHAQTPLTVAQSCSGLAASVPLFTAVLNYRHNPRDPEGGAAGVRVLRRGEAWTNYPVALTVDDLGDGFELTAQADLRVDAQRITGYLQTAVQSLVEALEDPAQTPALALPIVPESERRQVVESFNATQAEYPSEKVLHQLFEEQARRAPEATAVTHGGERLTYAELNRRSNQLAHFLRAHGIGPDRLVGLYVDRGLEMAVAMLGVLKAGGAYLPLDPQYPAERLAYMLKDAGPPVLLTQQHLASRLPTMDARIVMLDSEWSAIETYADGNIEPSVVGCTPRHLAYVIYTSGSTGAPKGVLLEHRGVCNLAVLQQRALGVKFSSRVLQFASCSFDACTWECTMALCAGACLCMVESDDLTPGEPLRLTLQRQRITHVTLPPVALAALPTSDGLKELGTLIVAGEACPISLVKQWAAGRRFVNGYGPTEATVCASMYICDTEEITSLPIGRPNANTQIYILDQDRRPVPIGVAGEIYIGGAGVARGYLNRPELTAQRFVASPFDADPQARLYKSGDVGRWRADGLIEYLGRNDQQVKIRGFRVELGEIEARLAQHVEVKEVAVIVREDGPGEKRLIAYIVPQNADAPTAQALRSHLKSMLPEHMIPSAFVAIERMPLTPNGKLDRRALPAPQLDAYASRQFEAPQGDVEQTVARIWEDLLRVQSIGREDNFFDLGGHSVLAMQTVARIQSSLCVEISVRSLFECPTLRELSAIVDDVHRMRLLESIEAGGEAIEETLEILASMPESKVQELLQKYTAEGRP